MPIKLNKLPISERPYEKLEMYGENTLSDSELLAIIIRIGTKEETAVQLAQQVLTFNSNNENLDSNDSLRFLQQISIKELTKIKGIGRVKAIQIKAVAEIAKRISNPIQNNKIIIKKPKDVSDLLMEELRYEKQEVLKVIVLNTKNIVQKITNIAVGGSFSINIQPKDILKEAVKMEMPKIIIVHNHPSGDPTPSRSDIESTDRLKQSAELLGIELLDHIVIGDGTYESIFSKKTQKLI